MILSESPDTAPGDRLAQAIGFTQADLVANRRGKITERQHRRVQSLKLAETNQMSQMRWMTLGIPLGMGVICWVMTLWGGWGFHPAPKEWVVFIALYGIVIAFSFWVIVRHTKQVQSGALPIERAEGVVGALPPILAARERFRWVLQVGNMPLCVDKDLSPAFIEGRTYRVYYIKPFTTAAVILSAEITDSGH